jgi:hypothetical protein
MRPILVCALAVMLGACAGHRGAAGQVVLREPGRTVEVLGLQRWTATMLQDSLDRHAPGVTLNVHACAAALRYRLGFPDASFAEYRDGERVHAVITVVEPQDSSRVRYRTARFDTAAPRPEWSVPISVLKGNPGAFQSAVGAYAAAAGRHPPYHPGSPDSVAMQAVWSFIDERRSGPDLATALDVLRGDPNVHNRMVAAAVLANFANRDAAWQSLMEALRESDGPVKAVAAIVLEGLAQSAARPVDWTSVTPTIHALLDGTSLFVTPTVLHVLRATAGDPRWAAPFLSGGGSILLSYLGSDYPPLREDARLLLVALSGRDEGYHAGRWRSWIQRLR